MTAIVWLSLTAFLLALLPALLYLRNRTHFRPPPEFDGVPMAVSVLIPARNEERSIIMAVESVLASRDVELEVIVLDDHSEDRTAVVVQSIAERDSRVRLETAPPLPPGWCGKQHACFVLSQFARHPVLMFLDADVMLTPDAVARMSAFLRSSKAGLVSGFPRQETGTLLEKLIIPLINWLLMCYLPMHAMRKSKQAGLGTGCGQWFATTREAYDAVGGHEAVKASLHDGIKLPRAYRKAGYMTDICDATDLAVCRMYRSASQVWSGLAKNAREGLGSPVAIWVWTVLLFGGHLLPFLLAALIGQWFLFEPIGDRFVSNPRPPTPPALHNSMYAAWFITVVACILSYLPRLAAAACFRASWLGALLHPLGVLLLLAIQWYATIRHWLGRPVGWKGRPVPSHV